MLINFACNNPECHNSIVKLFKSYKDVPPYLDCGECSSGKLERQMGAPNSKSVQFIDNGNSPKQVELNSEVVLKTLNKVHNE